ncbi:hypothetical protein AUK04_04415 [Candidatus Roizmanbacteria bacterium CG2_30_33_16]|uniref:Uncharacterized protein n=5 Tax=Candidatus Roizmaniibacteriota TaxID=1752723 RepID=A0A2M7E4B3_9BACT|nr:hypothetical protein [Candidatus Roizmanbacteria bacterium]OIP82610.1 MAG: hypothetical protein AUK04_04415 [Candidatus Roizmanbacteria bacterium CG2_30_33_16]PIP64060.1 MAG: hypothetical protein COW96_04635 [Candidatus Roizmanbacteria bacterium CG22_combo_CG10-13_8_21_14_all_33_16]PIV62561.1 MAG: hypothetical protein COS12_01950 [Candidatus Roizmanbacteria bacterium CG01_land_8_20_14_3_00_33_9]PIX69704.1 MAG: hypothetical protein COZ39_05170 [Candidatus Roizmanbacteria bacterium CG_4_10_14_
MKKETIIAVILGIGFGLIVAIFMVIRTGTQNTKNTKTIANSISSAPTKQINQSLVTNLEITSPKDNELIKDKAVSINGKATKNSMIIIQSSVKDIIIKNKEINFKVDMPLSLGENVIQVSVYPDDKNVPFQKKQLQVYYLAE